MYKQKGTMTIDEFNRLSDQEKNIELFEAQKIAERFDGFFKYELFHIDNFFVETKTSHFKFARRTIKCFLLQDLDIAYSAKIQALLSRI